MRAVLLPLLLLLTAASPAELGQWRNQAQRVTINRDDWGIAHVHGKSDADAVFGMIYAQAEDDFPRIEANYLTALGRTAEAEGEKAIWQDLRARLYVSEPELKARLCGEPAWLRRLMDSWAAGLNYYLATHPQVKPRVLTRFEPWMALSFTEGSIGGDIERIDLGRAGEILFGPPRPSLMRAPDDSEPRGSNGIAIAPALTAGGKALLLINPHTSFFFRSEQQVTSDEGLNAYGAATWGQFFIYQGFNAHAGWMHTSSGVDVVDEFAEQVGRSGNRLAYRFGNVWRPLGERPVTLRYRAADGRQAVAELHHLSHPSRPDRPLRGRPLDRLCDDGPAGRRRCSNRSSGPRRATCSRSSTSRSSRRTVRTTPSLPTPRARSLICIRNSCRAASDAFDYTKPVDGSDPAADWGSLHRINELPNVIRPPNGWVQNTNNWP